jgi:hypothetical protein
MLIIKGGDDTNASKNKEYNRDGLSTAFTTGWKILCIIDSKLRANTSSKLENKFYCCAGRTRRPHLWLAVLCLITISVKNTFGAEHDEDTEQYWTRLYYGLVASKETQVCIVEGYWSYAIHLELPELPTLTDTIPTATCERLCGRVKVLANATQLLLEQ